MAGRVGYNGLLKVGYLQSSAYRMALGARIVYLTTRFGYGILTMPAQCGLVNQP